MFLDCEPPSSETSPLTCCKSTSKLVCTSNNNEFTRYRNAALSQAFQGYTSGPSYPQILDPQFQLSTDQGSPVFLYR